MLNIGVRGVLNYLGNIVKLTGRERGLGKCIPSAVVEDGGVHT